MIELSHIKKIYRVGQEDFYALNDVNLKIQKGEFVSICGTSGSGKTTLLDIIGAIDTCSEGEYRFEGEDMNQLSDEKTAVFRNRKTGFVLQDFALINHQTVVYNVMLPLLFSKMPWREIRGKALNALSTVGVLDQAYKKANQLSGGQRQRVAIARAIVHDPAVLLADEPTGQLDSKTSMQIMELLKELNQTGITVIVVTHDAKVASFASRLITISDGKILSDQAV